MKKRILISLIFAIVIITISGCGIDMERIAEEKIVGNVELDGKMECIDGNRICSEWIDTETGVHYFYTQTGGLELRVNADGTPYCDK